LVCATRGELATRGSDGRLYALHAKAGNPELHGGGAEDWLRIALPICSRFVCEGIAPYLPPDALTGLLARLGERAAVGSTLVVELPLVTRSEEARSWRERLDAAVSEHGAAATTS
jgi:hypothetical protein